MLQPVCAAIAMTDMPLAARPSIACRFLWMNASCRSTAVMRADDVLVGDRPVRRDSSRPLVSFVVLAAKGHEQVRDRLAQQVVFLLAACLHRRELLFADLLELVATCGGSRSAFAW